MPAGGIMAATGTAMPNNIDPLAYEEDLTKAGVPAGQAHVHAEAIGKVKNELDELDSKFKISGSDGRVERGFSELNTKIDRTKVELEVKIDDVRADLEARIDGVKAELEARIDGVKAELEARIDGVKADLEARIDKTRADLELQIQRAKIETILWTAGIVISAFGVQGYVIVNMLK